MPAFRLEANLSERAAFQVFCTSAAGHKHEKMLEFHTRPCDSLRVPCTLYSPLSSPEAFTFPDRECWSACGDVVGIPGLSAPLIWLYTGGVDFLLEVCMF